ncbi:MAG TPA: hypothetical protein VKU39_19350 [Streptosporangiaceae bacterium]|nr:hypothetical protein [Streptosporangiaceae bacterium]
MPARVTRTAIVLAAGAVIAAVALYFAAQGVRRLTAPSPPAPGCSANIGGPYPLGFDQAGIAATIAAIADRRHLPERAVTIAYAAALQESDLEDLAYGDRDSVGVFQQRPSQGWGTTAQIEDPVYATNRFFQALVQIPRYDKIPVAKAAQAVQHSADGSAYGQYAYLGGQLADDFSGRQPHQVTCWYTPAATAKPDLTGVSAAMHAAFGPQLRATATRHTLQVKPGSGEAWTVASWLVAHAQQYQLRQVRYASYVWKAANGSMGWQRNTASTTVNNLVAS